MTEYNLYMGQSIKIETKVPCTLTVENVKVNIIANHTLITIIATPIGNDTCSKSEQPRQLPAVRNEIPDVIKKAFGEGTDGTGEHLPA